LPVGSALAGTTRGTQEIMAGAASRRKRLSPAPLAPFVRASRVISGPTRSYEILDAVGRAGIAVARQQGELGFSKLVAIKSVRTEHAETVHALLGDESRLRHANIVPTLDVVVEGPMIHVVMEYVEGPCIADLLDLVAARGVRLPVPVAAALVHDVLLGVEHAHATHDVPCDLSPRNVIVGFDGLARLIDIGAPAMSPLGERPDDIYACGVMLWQLLVNSRSPGVPATRPSGAIGAVTARATDRDPARRFRTASEMARALREATPLASRTEVSEAIVELPAGNTRVPEAARSGPRERSLAEDDEPPPLSLGLPIALAVVVLVVVVLGWFLLRAHL
jgi:serine/threonine-protein kinase